MTPFAALLSDIWTFVATHRLLTLVVFGGVFFLAIHVIWYIHPSDIRSTDELYARLCTGQPVIVEYYSNL